MFPARTQGDADHCADVDVRCEEEVHQASSGNVHDHYRIIAIYSCSRSIAANTVHS